MRWLVYLTATVLIISAIVAYFGDDSPDRVTRVAQPEPKSEHTASRATIVPPERTPTQSSDLSPERRHLKEKRYMLELINIERQRAGLSPVGLGSNAAAQLHAESELEHCSSSHWGIDGLKPYMRYSLGGDAWCGSGAR